MDQGEQALYALPQALLCRILYYVPLTKQKLRLCTVCRAWRQALLHPQSHSEQCPVR